MDLSTDTIYNQRVLVGLCMFVYGEMADAQQCVSGSPLYSMSLSSARGIIHRESTRVGG